MPLFRKWAIERGLVMGWPGDDIYYVGYLGKEFFSITHYIYRFSDARMAVQAKLIFGGK